MNKEEHILLELPMPPSLNCLFATVTKDRRGRLLKAPIRVKSEQYKEWIKIADEEYRKLDIDYNISWDNWLEVHLNFFFSLYTLKWDKRIKDTWNYEKAIIDWLWTKIWWFKDHKIKRIILEKHDSENNTAKILIKEI